MSLANRRQFAFFVSLHALCNAALQHPDMDEAVKPWLRRIIALVEEGDFRLEMTLTPKQLERLKADSRALADEMITRHSVLIALNVWLVWCEDTLAKLNHPAKRVAMEALHRELDGLYALLDPEYQFVNEALDAIHVARNLQERVA